MTRQNNVPLPEKDLKNVREGDPIVFPTLVPGKKKAERFFISSLVLQGKHEWFVMLYSTVQVQ